MLTTTGKTTFSSLRKFLALPVTLLVIGMLSVSTIESKANAIVAPIITAPQQPVSSVQQPEVAKRAPAQHRKKQVIKNDTVPAPAKAPAHTAEIKISENDEHITIRANSIVLSHKNKDSILVKSPPAIYYIDNQLASVDDVSKLKPENIRSVNVWKGDAAIKKFGNAGANGVIEIFTKLIP